MEIDVFLDKDFSHNLFEPLRFEKKNYQFSFIGQQGEAGLI